MVTRQQKDILILGNQFEEFFGEYREQMPRLRGAGLKPFSVREIMQERIKTSFHNALTLPVGQKYSEVRKAWWDNYFDTTDAVAYHPDGNIKIVLDAKPLQMIRDVNSLDEAGSLILPDGAYETLAGQEFTRAELEFYNWTARTGSREEVRKNQLWQIVAKSETLLEAYAEIVFTEAKKRKYSDENMGFYVSDTPKRPMIRPLSLNNLEGRCNATTTSVSGISSRIIGYKVSN